MPDNDGFKQYFHVFNENGKLRPKSNMGMQLFGNRIPMETPLAEEMTWNWRNSAEINEMFRYD